VKTLILYWHGLGDNILATPAIKKFKTTTGDYVGWMMMERLLPAKLMDSNPYIDQIHGCSDAWHCAGSENIVAGSQVVREEAKKVAEKYEYDRIIEINHNNLSQHKIITTATDLGVVLGPQELKTELYKSPVDLTPYYEKIKLPDEYVFFNGIAGLKTKTLPLEYAKKWLDAKGITLPIVSPDFTWDVETTPIHFAIEVMRGATHRILADSVMYHAAHAGNMHVDLAYFQRGLRIWEEVKPLHVDDRNSIVTSL
jgi:hypothetical protein